MGHFGKGPGGGVDFVVVCVKFLREGVADAAGGAAGYEDGFLFWWRHLWEIERERGNSRWVGIEKGYGDEEGNGVSRSGW